MVVCNNRETPTALSRRIAVTPKIWLAMKMSPRASINALRAESSVKVR